MKSPDQPPAPPVEVPAHLIHLEVRGVGVLCGLSQLTHAHRTENRYKVTCPQCLALLKG